MLNLGIVTSATRKRRIDFPVTLILAGEGLRLNGLRVGILMEVDKMKFKGWVSTREIDGFRAWLFHIWNDYELWNTGGAIDGVRILGFEWTR